ncbi:Glyoxalase/Bleomycin resistance protein/Dihydroxybiphenyl dioxygenase [Didymella exigua CBS 183.55]|uniref:Glyoxalase/Bleomycin resistance protein/Dihydroxybiphenyl dioxygenase n=1 Tax=Didymella exigua CBS 183.55 TaxID=1150837 RepID=A0A6A5RIV5_9PLEO|nr:Glyoxalase/Bleomycin resistance protein/Dihydroxybiphenyl dioxygenase [Didymella exigua CBS 183.55]KAF1926904.1 Glyoxalase/Bleomycin resistance protein/Dihydroxybiphenyl dioxygenase [Didymella exigua CBS 183.55]
MTQGLESASLAARVDARPPSRSWGMHRHNNHVNMLISLSRRGFGVISRCLVTVHHQKMAAFSVKSLDHVVITAKDIPTTIEFYTKRLGMKHEVFEASGGERHALSFGNQKLNLHQSGKEFEPKAQHVQPGSEDLCFVTDYPIDEVLKNWQLNGIEVLESGKVVERTGAVGKLRSVYCRDPDGNLIEVSNYV